MFLWWKSCCSCKVQEVKDGRISSRIGTSWIENSVNVYFFSSNNHFSKKLQSNSDVFLLKKSFEMYGNHFLQVQIIHLKTPTPPKKSSLVFSFSPHSFSLWKSSSFGSPRYLVKVGRKGEPRMGRGLPFSSMSFTWITSLGWWWEPKGSKPRVLGTQGVFASGNPKGVPKADGWETYPLKIDGVGTGRMVQKSRNPNHPGDSWMMLVGYPYQSTPTMKIPI